MKHLFSAIMFFFILGDNKLSIKNDIFLTDYKKNINIPVEFYFFTKMKYKPQPSKSNWCWASCLESILSGVNSNSKIGKEKHDFVFNYKKYLKKHDIQTFNSANLNLNECTKNPRENKCNLTIVDDHIIPIFKLAGLKVQELKALNKLNNYDFIVEKLKKNKGPILLRIFKNSRSHMVMIKGYGKTDTCNYLLISDPDERINEEYINHEKLIIIDSTKLDLRKAWFVILKNSSNLTKDFIIEEKYNEAYKYVENLKTLKNKSFHKDLLDPWPYITNKNNNSNFTNCEPIGRKLTIGSNIKFVSPSNLISYDYKLNEIIYSYFDNIKTKVIVKKINDSIYIKSIFHLNKSSVNNKWQLYEEFTKNYKTKQ